MKHKLLISHLTYFFVINSVNPLLHGDKLNDVSGNDDYGLAPQAKQNLSKP